MSKMPTTVLNLAEKYMPRAERKKLEKARASETPPTMWAHLKNAPHIDKVIEHLKANPKLWTHKDEEGAVCSTRHADACSAAWAEARKLDRYREWDSARCAAWLASSYRAIDAISALVAWDFAGKLMGYQPDQLQHLSNVEPDNHAAVLLTPAVIVLSGINTIM